MCLGIPGRIVEISTEGKLPMGLVDFGGVKRDVCLAYVGDDVGVGDYVIVHVGFAISVVDEQEANRTFELLTELAQPGGFGLPARDAVSSLPRKPGLP